MTALGLIGAALTGASSGVTSGVFAALALVAVVTALAVVLHRNVVVQALFLVLHLLTIAGLYVSLGAYFFAAIQVLVYAGAILVLIVFVIMLLNLGKDRSSPGLLSLGLALVLGVLLVLLLGRAGRGFNAPAIGAGAGLPADPDWGTVARMADALFGPYFFPFEVVSLILIAGMIGAILLAKRHLEG